MRKYQLQLPLRRVYFLQQAWHIRSIICAQMYYGDGYKMPQIAKYLGVSVATVHTYLHLYIDGPSQSAEDYAVAFEVLRNLRSPLYATHW